MDLFRICSHYSFRFGFILLFIFSSCRQFDKNKSHQNVSDKSIAKGSSLANQYCQSCHLLPSPELLDADTWENGVLPAMGPHLGIFSYDFKRYPSYKSDVNLDKSFYPKKPVVSTVEWQSIIDYYTSLAPDKLSIPSRVAIIPQNKTFIVQQPIFNYASPAISLTKFDTSTVPNQLYLFDLATQKTMVFDSSLKLTDSISSNAAFVDFDFTNQKILGCNVGVINPNNGKFGEARYLQRKLNGRLSIDTSSVLKSLARPVQIATADLNNDQKKDFLVCEFGHLTGALSWMESKGNNQYERHILRAQPGAIKAYITDANHDGLPDVWALFTQGDEGIFLFTNKGNGQFEERNILRFPPVYGSTYFEFADFNKDGFQDIVYTCGDNADYSMILKPYHGVYIFLNDGKNNFTQKYFYPINGCYKAIARDYDKDGDVDIATISFFADYESLPDEGFVYLENKGQYNFEPSTFKECEKGRWLTMDAGDIDGDGRTDLVLANFSIRPSVTKPTADWKKGPIFLVLKNISK